MEGKKFQLKGIASPGRMDIMGLGIVNIETLPEDLQEKLWKEGNPFLEPTPEYRKILYPNETEIGTPELKLPKKKK